MSELRAEVLLASANTDMVVSMSTNVRALNTSASTATERRLLRRMPAMPPPSLHPQTAQNVTRARPTFMSRSVRPVRSWLSLLSAWSAAARAPSPWQPQARSARQGRTRVPGPVFVAKPPVL